MGARRKCNQERASGPAMGVNHQRAFPDFPRGPEVVKLVPSTFTRGRAMSLVLVELAVYYAFNGREEAGRLASKAAICIQKHGEPLSLS